MLSWGTAILAAIGALGVCMAWYFIPKVLARRVDLALFDREDKLRVALAGLLTAMAVIVGVFVTIYQFRASQKTQMDIEVTKVFLESIKLLGSSDPTGAGHAGAIYAMQPVMEYDAHLHNSVINTLIALIRAQRSTMTNPTCELKRINDVPEIQAAIDVIGTRINWKDQEDGSLDFSQLCLLGATFNNLHFENAQFNQSDLRRTSFEGAYVEGANFSSSDMDYWEAPDVRDSEKLPDGIETIYAKEQYREYEILTLFRGARAKGAHFDGACLRGVDFSRAKLQDTSFADAELSAANFEGTEGVESSDRFKAACAQMPAFNLPAGSVIAKCFDEKESGRTTVSPYQQCNANVFRVFGQPK